MATFLSVFILLREGKSINNLENIYMTFLCTSAYVKFVLATQHTYFCNLPIIQFLHPDAFLDISPLFLYSVLEFSQITVGGFYVDIKR